MLTTIVRTVILYAVVNVSVRLMGKRQIGELQPAELVITILISEIAAIPIQDNAIQLINSIIPVAVLVGLEIISSAVSLKSLKFRYLSEGHAVAVIKNGKIDFEAMKSLRFSLDDLISALRQKDVFDISEVECAVMETNGVLSVLLKPECRTVTAGDAGINTDDCGLMHYPVIDGRIIKDTLGACALDKEALEHILRKDGVKKEEIILMSVDKNNRRKYILKGKKN